MQALFPNGVTLKTYDDHLRMQFFSLMVVKLSRYAANWDEGHPDSLDDLSVYSQMLKGADQDIFGTGQRG